MTLLQWLIGRYPAARKQTLKRMLARITINGRPARSLKAELAESDKVHVSQRADKPAASADPLRIIHEDADILVVDKPAGLLTSTITRERRPTAIAIIRAYLAARQPLARAGVIHRLDRDAAGLLVFSKNHEAYRRLKEQFFNHTVDRIYTAVVEGHLPQPAGRIDSRLIERPDGSVVPTRDQHKGQRAITDYKVIGRSADRSVLRVMLRTGRKHQIRAHMAQLGHPVVGDPVYWTGEKADAALMLCATELAFDHPRTGQRLRFELPLPEAVRAMLGG